MPTRCRFVKACRICFLITFDTLFPHHFVSQSTFRLQHGRRCTPITTCLIVRLSIRFQDGWLCCIARPVHPFPSTITMKTAFVICSLVALGSLLVPALAESSELDAELTSRPDADSVESSVDHQPESEPLSPDSTELKLSESSKHPFLFFNFFFLQIFMCNSRCLSCSTQRMWKWNICALVKLVFFKLHKRHRVYRVYTCLFMFLLFRIINVQTWTKIASRPTKPGSSATTPTGRFIVRVWPNSHLRISIRNCARTWSTLLAGFPPSMKWKRSIRTTTLIKVSWRIWSIETLWSRLINALWSTFITGNYKKFTGLKSYNKNLKTMIAIGGWNEGSKRFVKSKCFAELVNVDRQTIFCACFVEHKKWPPNRIGSGHGHLDRRTALVWLLTSLLWYVPN